MYLNMCTTLSECVPSIALNAGVTSYILQFIYKYDNIDNV